MYTREREDNTDNRKRRGQHKTQAQIWTDTDKTKECNSCCLYIVDNDLLVTIHVFLCLFGLKAYHN